MSFFWNAIAMRLPSMNCLFISFLLMLYQNALMNPILSFNSCSESFRFWGRVVGFFRIKNYSICVFASSEILIPCTFIQIALVKIVVICVSILPVHQLPGDRNWSFLFSTYSQCVTYFLTHSRCSKIFVECNNIQRKKLFNLSGAVTNYRTKSFVIGVEDFLYLFYSL